MRSRYERKERLSISPPTFPFLFVLFLLGRRDNGVLKTLNGATFTSKKTVVLWNGSVSGIGLAFPWHVMDVSNDLYKRSKALARQDVKAGALVGITAGLVMIFVFMIYSALNNAGFWTPLKAIASTVMGSAALRHGADAIVTGTFIHLLVSAAWGAIFCLFVHQDTPFVAAFWQGILYGLVTWALMTLVVAPYFDPVIVQFTNSMAAAWFTSHLLFGASLTLTPFFENHFERQIHLPELS